MVLVATGLTELLVLPPDGVVLILSRGEGNTLLLVAANQMRENDRN